MKFKNYLLNLGTLCGSLVLFSACSENSSNSNSGNADQEALLNYTASKIILPGYYKLDSLSQNLDLSFNAFVEQKDSSSLAELREDFLAAYTAWVQVEVFEIGPAAQNFMRQNLNTFPVDTAKIETNLTEENFQLSSLSNYVAKGFSALDYLLFHPTKASLESLKDTLRLNYADTLIKEIRALSNKTYSAWSKDYKATFVSNTGTQVGSSIGDWVNQLNYDYETLGKWSRVGIPLGKPLTVAKPEQSEARFSKHSLDLLKAQMESIYQMFTGVNPADTNTYALSKYLDDLDAKYLDKKLSEQIELEFEKLLEIIESIDAPLDEAVIDQYDKVNELYNQIQRLVILLKSDMPSAMSVSIQYQDNDGD